MTKDKVRGMMLGVAISDQLGMPVETYTREKIQERYGRITYYIDPDLDHKWFGGLKSRWTDDTQLTLVVAESLIAKKCIDMDDMARRHIESFQKEGDLGWGKSTKEAVKRLTNGSHWEHSGSYPGSGNGVVMKVAPIAGYLESVFWNRTIEGAPLEIIKNIANLAFMTHAVPLSIESALAQVFAVKYCLMQNPPVKFITNSDFIFNVLGGTKRIKELTKYICKFTLSERFKAFRAFELEKLSVEAKLELFEGASSYVESSLPFSYSMFLENPISIKTLYDTINAGGDTDTNGSIVGALLGALNGTKIFPKHLVEGLWQRERILDTAERLCEAFEIKD